MYFHAYFWYILIQTLFYKSNPKKIDADFDSSIIAKSVEVHRLKGLADSLRKVEANLTRFPFNKEIYEKFVEDFGGRKPVKKTKLLEDIQRALFVA